MDCSMAAREAADGGGGDGGMAEGVPTRGAGEDATKVEGFAGSGQGGLIWFGSGWGGRRWAGCVTLTRQLRSTQLSF